MRIMRFAPVLAAALLLSSATPGRAGGPDTLASLTTGQASGGLKEALTQGIGTAVSETGKPGGYENNPAIRIVMPAKLA